MMEANPGYSNPFGVHSQEQPTSQMNAVASAANPFGGATSDPWGAQPQGTMPPPPVAPESFAGAGGYPSYPAPSNSMVLNQNPFGVAPSSTQSPYGFPPPDPANGHAPPFGAHGTNAPGALTQPNSYSAPQHDQNPYGFAPQPPPQQQMYEPPPPPAPSNPFDATVTHTALVVAPTQSNPYAMAPQPYGYSQPQQQQLATVPQPSNPWGMPQSGYGAAAAPANSYDPFTMTAPPPPPAPVQQPMSQELDTWFQSTPAPAPATPSAQLETYPPTEMVSNDPPGIPANGQPQDPPPRNSEQYDHADKPLPDSVSPPRGTTYPPQLEYGQRPSDEPDPDTPNDLSPRNPYAPTLAREAPPGASPLPKAELVKKRGFVLGRISFRTIVMKKWKQTYWVQYGPHTMLWFRSQADFDDWLNNPYHLQTERNFLIKLAVNFVHDLYKPNVRGYQVTQCRTKGYGNKIVRQFKLERWMDYGPTIAAAFGSYNPAEVDALREAVVECMRNTPLNGGIRATGAVRQPNPMPQRDQYGEEDDDGYREQDGGRRSSYDDLPPDSKETERNDPRSESVAEEADLLDVNNWDDVPVEPQVLQPVTPSQASFIGGPHQQPAPYGAPPAYGGAAPHDAQQYHPQQVYQQPPHTFAAPPPAPQADYSTALVPATDQNRAYPGAPQQWASQQPPQQYQQQQPPPQQYQQQQQQPPQQYQQQNPFQQQAPPPSQHPHQAADPWSSPPAQPQPTYLAPPEY